MNKLNVHLIVHLNSEYLQLMEIVLLYNILLRLRDIL